MRFFYSLFFSFLFSANVFAVKYLPSSFIYVCSDTSSEYHLMPISFNEFEISENEELADIELNINQFENLSPQDLKKFLQKYEKISLTKNQFSQPSEDRVDSILTTPKGCRTEVALMANVPSQASPLNVFSNAEIWDQLNNFKKLYLMFELKASIFLDGKMLNSPVDIRRFAFTVAVGRYRDFSEREFIYFLQYFKLTSFLKSDILIDTFKNCEFYSNGNLKDGYALENSTYSKAKINSEKWVSFYLSGKLQALSTLEPLEYEFLNQKFIIFNDPNSYSNEFPRDLKRMNRIHFYENGYLKNARVAYLKNIFNFVTNIKPSFENRNKFIDLTFYKNGVPMSVIVDYGQIQINSDSYEIHAVEFYENGMAKIVYLFRTIPRVTLADGQVVERVSRLFLDDSGSLLKAF